MITNKNMSNEELVEKLMNSTMDLYEKDYVGARDIERFNNIREEILSRMNTEEINIDVVILVEDKKKCPMRRNF